MDNFDSLKQIIRSGEVGAAEYALAVSLLGSADIDALAAAYLKDARIALHNYSIEESEADQSIAIRGTGVSTPFTGMTVEARFTLHGADVTLLIRAGGDYRWSLAASFPILKGSLIAGLRFDGTPGFTLASYDFSDRISKNTLSFEGKLSLGSVLDGLQIFFGGIGPTLSGPIRMKYGVPDMTLSTTIGASIDIGFSQPLSLAFEACSEAFRTAVQGEGGEENLPDARVFLRFRTAIPFKALEREYSIPLAAIIYDPTSDVVFSIDLENFTDFVAAGIGELSALTNGIPLADKLPSLKGFQLAEFVTLRNLWLYVNPTSATKLTAIVLTIESRKPWTILQYEPSPGRQAVIGLDAFEIRITLPMATKRPEFAVTGLIPLGDQGRLVLSLFTPDLTLSGGLEPGEPLNLKEAIAYFAGTGLVEIPAITIADFNFFLQPGTGEFDVAGTVTGDWSFPLGVLSSFALKEVRFGLNRSASAGFSGSVGGKASLGSATFDASYAFPGNNFAIGGNIPKIQIGELISTLSSNALTLPEELNFTLEDSEIAITKSGSDYVFFLQTKVKDVGTLFFQIQRTSSTGWGAAVGIDLSVVKKLGDLPGFGFMNAIDLTFERMALVLSSVDLPSGYTFPEPATYRGTAPAASGKVTIPGGIGTPKRGINFYAQFAFGDRAAARDAALLKLYDFFNLQRVLLDVAMQVTYSDGNLSGTLLAGAAVGGNYSIAGSSTKYNMDLAAYLAIEFSTGGSAALFLRGLLKLDAPGTTTREKLTFATELGLQPNGFYVAGSMTGSWTNPFGIQGLTVSDVGLMVGLNWEGIPSAGFAGTLTVTSFQGSLACIVNSENPVNSVLAGSLSDLTLGDVVNTFVGLAGEPDPTAKEIISVLKNISVEGINSFPIPEGLAGAFDGKDLKRVAAAFGQYAGITLTPTPEGTMLIVGVPGESWFITDKTNGVTHYEITRQGNRLIVRQQAQLYLSPNKTRIAAIDFPQGYQIYGQLNIFGFKQRTDVSISINRGIGAEVRMSRINLFGGLLRVERAPGDTRDGGNDGGDVDGPYLSISTYPRPPYNTPHIYISGSLSFLGILDQVMDIKVSEKGIRVLIDRKFLGTRFNFSFDFKASPLYLAGGGTAGLKLSPKIDLSRFGLGTYNILDVDFTADLRFAASGEKLIAHASGNFYFSIPEINVKLGPYSLDVDLINIDQPLAKLQNLFDGAVQGIGSLAGDLANRLLTDAKSFARLAERGIITLTESLDAVLKRTFNVSLADLYATTECFAGSRLAPRMMRPLSPMLPYTPAPGEPFPGAPAPNSDDPLARLRQLRDDLGESAMGQWILDIYNTLSEPLVHLYDYRPTDPDHPTFDQVLTENNGYQIYNDLLKLLQTAGGSRPFNVTNEFVMGGLALVSQIIDLAALYAETGDPVRQREGELIVTGITALVEQAPLLQQFQGLDYEGIKAKVKTMTPPANPFV